MLFGYKSEFGAVCSAMAAAVCLSLTPRRFLPFAVLTWLVLQRLIARGSMNRCRPPPLLSRALPDASRPVAIVTGTNSGIGFYTAIGLAAAGFRVVCTCRSPALSASTADTIRTAAQTQTDASQQTVLVDGRFSMECDDFASVRRFVTGFLAAYDRLDVLVNNAGMMRRDLAFSAHAPHLEVHTAVNFLGPLLLTELLVPCLRRSGGRVVYVASEAHRFPQLLLDGVGKGRRRVGGRLLAALRALNTGHAAASGPLAALSLRHAFVRYGTSKLLNIYHAHHIARRCGVPACSLHPGCVGTNFSKDLMPHAWVNRLYQYASLLFLKSWKEGAQTTLHCAMCGVDELRLITPDGETEERAVSPYFVECGNQTRASLLRYAWDLEEAESVVEWGKQLVGLAEEGQEEWLHEAKTQKVLSS